MGWMDGGARQLALLRELLVAGIGYITVRVQ